MNFSHALGYVFNLSTENTSLHDGLTTDNNESSLLANITRHEVGNQFILPVWRQILWIILYAVMVVVATIGNVMVIWVILTNKRMRTVTNYFLLNLSIADTMVSTLNVIFNFIYMLHSHWPFGELYCKISPFIAVLSVCASVFSLMSISIDRYMAIMTPLRPRMGRTTTLLLALTTWLLGIIIGSPSLMFYTIYVLPYHDGKHRIICYPEWPDGPTNESMIEYIYNVAFLLITYIVPVFSMSYAYTKIGLELWGSKSIGESTQRQVDNIKSKRRIVKMMMVVVIIFAVCWLPYHLYFILTSYFPSITSSPYIQETYLAIYWLAMSNSMYNPIIYCWMNARFRRGFIRMLSCIPCLNITANVLTRQDVLTGRRRSYSASPEHNRTFQNGTVRVNCTTRPSPTSSINTCYSNVMEENMQARMKRRRGCEMKPIS